MGEKEGSIPNQTDSGLNLSCSSHCLEETPKALSVHVPGQTVSEDSLRKRWRYVPLRDMSTFQPSTRSWNTRITSCSFSAILLAQPGLDSRHKNWPTVSRRFIAS